MSRPITPASSFRGDAPAAPASGLAALHTSMQRPMSPRGGYAASPRPESPRTEAARLQRLEMENERLRNEVTRLKAGVVYTAASSGPGGQARASPRARAPSPRRVASPRAQAPMDQEQAVREAQLRQLHNKQRAQLKAFLQLSAGNSKTVGTDDLKLAAKLAKMSLPDEYLQSSQHASKFVASKGEDGAPRDIQWQEFVRALEPENVYKTKADAAKKAARRRALAQKRQASASPEAGAAAALLSSGGGPPITMKELRAAHGKIRDHFTTRFTEVRRGFRLLDEDHSGHLTKEEMRAVIMMFNLDIKQHLLTKIIEVADVDGDGDIDYAEFARIMTCEDIVKEYQNSRELKGMATGEKERRVGGPTLRPGVTPDQLRSAQQTFKSEFEEKYRRLTDAFKFIDADRTGYLERDEIKRLLLEFNIVDITPEVIDNLIDFADYDGDGEINYAEFARVLSADDVMNMANTLSYLEAQKGK